MKANAAFRVYSTEDNPAHQELLRIAFGRTNADVRLRFFNTAEELVTEMSAVMDAGTHLAWMPDLFLVDVRLPGISGPELVRKLRENFAISDVPIVMLSSSIAHRDREEAFESGADDFFTKPASLGDLVSMVGNIVADWQNAKTAEQDAPNASRSQRRHDCRRAAKAARLRRAGWPSAIVRPET